MVSVLLILVTHSFFNQFHNIFKVNENIITMSIYNRKNILNILVGCSDSIYLERREII